MTDGGRSVPYVPSQIQSRSSDRETCMPTALWPSVPAATSSTGVVAPSSTRTIWPVGMLATNIRPARSNAMPSG